MRPPSDLRGLSLSALLLSSSAAGAVAAAGSREAHLPAECDSAVVGGGWAGVYSAFRLAESGRGVCLFEATERIGGRTYSKTFQVGRPGENFTLDVGAYRFSPDMHLPGDVILKLLKLPVACYEPTCPDASLDFPPPFHFNYSAPLVRIVDAAGQPSGYVTAIEGLVKRLVGSGRGQVFLGQRLTDASLLAGSDGGVRLKFGSGQAVFAKHVMLNLPRSSLLGLPTLHAQTSERTAKAQKCVKFDLPSDMFKPGQMFLGRSLTKAYAFYDEAWWHTRLNRTMGQWPENAFFPTSTSEGIPIGIHFNDGPVHCDAPLVGCRGFLEVFYSTAEETFFEDLRPDPDHPLGILTASDDPSGKLGRLHAAVMEATGPLWKAAAAAPPTAPPSMLVVGVWDREGHGLTAPTKVYYSTSGSVPGGPDPLQKACGVHGLTEDEYRKSMLAPLAGDLRILVANNDWVAQRTEDIFGDWAEESLLQAERGMRLLGLPRPDWLDAAYYEAKVVAFAEMGVFRDAKQGPEVEVLV